MEIGYAAIFYTIGSLPIAWVLGMWVARSDIRNLGSGNAGVMNVALHVSRWAGVVALAAEAAKGALVIYLARRWQLSATMTGVAIVAAVLGTCWSVWIRGAGGRGTTLGVSALLVLSWPIVAICLAIWVAARVLTRNSFLATRIWILSLPVSIGLVMNSTPYITMGAALCLLYLSAHKTGTDDHALLKQNWPSLWAFITAAPRRGYRIPKCRS